MPTEFSVSRYVRFQHRGHHETANDPQRDPEAGCGSVVADEDILRAGIAAAVNPLEHRDLLPEHIGAPVDLDRLTDLCFRLDLEQASWIDKGWVLCFPADGVDKGAKIGKRDVPLERWYNAGLQGWLGIFQIPDS